MNSALKGIVAGLIMAGIFAVMTFLGFWNNQINLVFLILSVILSLIILVCGLSIGADLSL